MTDMVCQDDRRRTLLRDRRRNSAGLNGIDFVEVEADDQNNTVLHVYFIAKLPDAGRPFELENIKITGGRRVTDVEAQSVEFERVIEDAYDDYAVVRLNKAGDHSIYTLQLAADAPDEPLAGFDPRYTTATFSFQAGGPVEIDCVRDDACPPERLPTPELNYLAKDYASFRQLLLDRLAQTLPDWRERHSPDLYLTLIEVLAYVGDHLSYYQDAVATEAYLATARRRISVRRHVRLVDYRLHEGCNARAWVCLQVAGDPLVNADQIAFITRPASNREPPTVLLPDDVRSVPRTTYELFEPIIERRTDAFAERDMLHPRQVLERLEHPEPQSAELRYLKLHIPPELLRQVQAGDADLSELAGALAGVLDALLSDPGLAQLRRAALPAQAARHGSLNSMRGTALRRYNHRQIEDALGDAVAQPTALTFHQAHNTIRFYTWGQAECCLPSGATSATLEDAWEDEGHNRRALRHLRKGDVLIFEEVLGPRTGLAADADPLHRHAVRLIDAVATEDPLGGPELPPEPGHPQLPYGKTDTNDSAHTDYPPSSQSGKYEAPQAPSMQPYPQPKPASRRGQPVVTITWEPADALPFALCLSAIGPAPDCTLLEHVSVVRGNVLLVDHGETLRDPGAVLLRDGVRSIPALPFEDPFTHVSFTAPELRCEGENDIGEVFIGAGRYQPQLARTPLVFAEPLPPLLLPAARVVQQNPAKALPQVQLFAPLQRRPHPGDVVERQPTPGPGTPATALYERWLPQPDLLASGADDRHFVVEVDDDGTPHLRFGDGAHGATPPPGACFLAAYRVGGGVAGNVGAESISHALLRGEIRGGAVLSIRNPLAAQGGTAPEPLAEVRLRAPHAFRSTLARAITADDYAALVLQPQDVPGHEHDIIERVQRASATISAPDPASGRSNVTITLDPLGGHALDLALRDMLAKHLERYRRIGHQLTWQADFHSSPAAFVPLRLNIKILVHRRTSVGHVRTALLEQLGNRVLADGRRGFFHPDNWTFGQSVPVSAIVAAARAIPGVVDARVQQLHRMSVADPAFPDNGLLIVQPHEIARLDNDPNFPENGVLKLDLEQQP